MTISVTHIRPWRCAVALALAACTTWRPLPLSPSEKLPYVVRITRTDSSRVTLLSSFVRRDTLYGRAGRDTVGVPLSGIRLVEREQWSVLRTAVVVIALPAVILGTLYLIQCGGHGCQPTPI